MGKLLPLGGDFMIYAITGTNSLAFIEFLSMPWPHHECKVPFHIVIGLVTYLDHIFLFPSRNTMIGTYSG